MKLTRTFIALSVLPLLLAGCTSNRVSVVRVGRAGAASTAPAELRTYASFNDVRDDYRIEGVITAGILPLMSNKDASREALLRKGAALVGVNSLVGLKHLNEQWGGYGVSCALLANTGIKAGASEASGPGFIVCIVPTVIKTGKRIEAGKLAARLVAELGYQLTEKGYYTYPCRPWRVDQNPPTLEQMAPSSLKEPLGVEPDLVLQAEIEEGTYLGLQALFMRVTLYDLKERKSVWVWSEKEEMSPPVVQWGLLEQLTSSDKLWFSKSWGFEEQTYSAVKKAAKKLPPVPGLEKLKM